jgi:hypothetical protein
MKTIYGLLACLPLILGSCSTYKKVSLNNFEEYSVSKNDVEDLQYVLKSNKLHYLATDSRNYVNLYEGDKSTPKESYSFLIQDNIVIPTGSRGVCVNPSNDNFAIDFGKGIIVPFKVYNDYNRANSEIVVNERTYSFQVSNQNPSLYFNIRELKSLKSK